MTVDMEAATPNVSISMPSLPDMVGRLHECAPRYYQECNDSTVVTLRRKAMRSNSLLYWFRLQTSDVERRVIVKCPFSRRQLRSGHNQASSTPVGKSAQYPKPPVQVKGLREYRALSAIENYFDQQEDNRFGTIRALDIWTTPYAVVMEEGADQNLKSLFRKANRLLRPFVHHEVLRAFENTGAWLRQYHDMTPLDYTATRDADPASFRSSIAEALDYLRKAGEKSAILTEAQRILIEDIACEVPTTWPLGVVHGDFAPRNVLVSPNGRVTVFDTHANWQAPIYEDLAHFLIAVKASGPQIVTQGLLYGKSTLLEYENAFLSGYFGNQEIPRILVSLFECQRLLEWWAALDFRYRKARRLRRIVKGLRLKLWRPSLKRLLSQNLNSIEGRTSR